MFFEASYWADDVAPYSLGTQLRRLELFTPHDHPNTLAPLERSGLWVVLHKLGKVGA